MNDHVLTRKALETATGRRAAGKQSGMQRNIWRTSMLVAHVVLSLVLIVGVFFLVYAERLQGQEAVTLIGAIVFSIFGRVSK